MSGRPGSGRTEAEALLADLLAAGAIPLVEDHRLRVEAPGGVLDARRRERLAGCAEPDGGMPCRADRSCCLCGAPLPKGHRYLCHACVQEQAEQDRRRWAAKDGAG